MKTIDTYPIEVFVAGGLLSSRAPSVVPGPSTGTEAGALQPHLQGVGTSSNGPGVENPIAAYFDGVYYDPYQSSEDVGNPPRKFDVTGRYAF